MIKNILTLLFIMTFGFGFAQNYGVQLDGTNGAISVCHDDAFNIAEEFTIEAWIYSPEWRPEFWQGSIVNKDQQGPNSGFSLRAGSNGMLSFVIAADGVWPEAISGEIMNTNQWNHVAGVLKDNVATIYLNGTVLNSAPINGTFASNMQNLTIGASPGFPGRVWNGILDEIRVWNVARTGQEIMDNMTVELSGGEAGLLVYMPMNEGEGTTVGNIGEVNCDGTFDGLTESAWVEGYSIPEVDLGIVSISAPDVIAIYNRPVRVKVEIQNFGSEAVSDIPVVLTVNGLPKLEETYNGTLEPGEVAAFTFEQPVDLTENNTNLLNCSTNKAEDANALNNSTTYRYKKPDDEYIINILNEEQHNFGGAGQTQFTLTNLPKNVEDFQEILLHFSLECPAGGCDPWDQPAKISVVTPDGVVEIARFITPYGIECGPWTVDVTDFKTLLTGATNFESYIQVWGANGWLLNADLEYVMGDNPVYQRLNGLWETDYLVYGDPDVDYDLPAVSTDIGSNTKDAHMRMTISGHGQGNTDNAAEFSQQTHEIFVDGSQEELHFLWKSDCAQNVCSNQGGNWTPNRAGWCPGQEVAPFLMDMTGLMTPGQALEIDYVLQEYTNLLNTDYNDGSHTEPHYRIHSFLVEQSDERYSTYTNLRAENLVFIDNGNSGNPVMESVKMSIYNSGSESVSNPTVSYWVNESEEISETYNGSIAPGETVEHVFSAATGFTFDDDLVFGIVSASNDEDVSDDGVLGNVDGISGIEDQLLADVDIYPNPSTGNVRLDVTDAFNQGELSIVDLEGKVIYTQNINANSINVEIERSGMYMILLRTKEGIQVAQRVVILD